MTMKEINKTLPPSKEWEEPKTVKCICINYAQTPAAINIVMKL